MIAVVAGATGLTGKALVLELLNDPRITRVVALVRARHGLSTHPKLEEALFEEGASGEVYFCCIGTTIRKAGSRSAFKRSDFDAVMAFAKLCETRGGQSFVMVSAMGASSKAFTLYSRTKGEAEEGVLGFKIPRIVIVRPSLLIGERAENRPLERASIVAWKKLAPWMPEWLRIRSGTPIPELAKLLVREGAADSPARRVLLAHELWA